MKRGTAIVAVAPLLLVLVAMGIAVASRAEAEQRESLETTFAGLPQPIDSGMSSSEHTSRHIVGQYATTQSADEIMRFFDRELVARAWQTSTATWIEGDLVLKCFASHDGRLTLQLAAIAVRRAPSFAYRLDLSPGPCSAKS